MQKQKVKSIKICELHEIKHTQFVFRRMWNVVPRPALGGSQRAQFHGTALGAHTHTHTHSQMNM